MKLGIIEATTTTHGTAPHLRHHDDCSISTLSGDVQETYYIPGVVVPVVTGQWHGGQCSSKQCITTTLVAMSKGIATPSLCSSWLARSWHGPPK